MAEEREQEQSEEQRSDAPFDDNPPVEPGTPQVGNSKAKFFMPREDEQEEGDDEQEEGAEEQEGESEESDSA